MIRVTFAIIAALAMTGCDEDREPDPYDLDFDIPRTEAFGESLTAYGLYQDPIAALQPVPEAQLYELSSELFTDYAAKQRLVRVPDGESVTVVDGALVYPEGSILAKTFYYPLDMRDDDGARRIIETRLLIKREGLWNVATYLWNDDQTDATLLLKGTTTEVSWTDESGESRGTRYAVPHEGECVTCHQQGEVAAYIGPTARNLNRAVTRGGESVNQLAHLQDAGVLVGDDWEAPTIPDYRDVEQSLESRARAYLDVNCAHCHNPGGWDEASEERLDLRYSRSLGQTNLPRKSRDVRRQLNSGDMPFLGTTLKHEQGVKLVLDYLDTL